MEDKLRIVNKIRKCLELAADTRGNINIRETAWRQAQALIKKHGIYPDDPLPPPAEEGPPQPTSPAWAPYWAQRVSADAARARVQSTVLCRDGWYVPK